MVVVVVVVLVVVIVRYEGSWCGEQSELHEIFWVFWCFGLESECECGRNMEIECFECLLATRSCVLSVGFSIADRRGAPQNF